MCLIGINSLKAVLAQLDIFGCVFFLGALQALINGNIVLDTRKSAQVTLPKKINIAIEIPRSIKQTRKTSPSVEVRIRFCFCCQRWRCNSHRLNRFHLMFFFAVCFHHFFCFGFSPKSLISYQKHIYLFLDRTKQCLLEKVIWMPRALTDRSPP